MANFRTRLKDLRSQSGLSQAELAGKLLVTKQTISQYERGVREPDYESLLALCDVFNVSSDYLLGKADVTLRLLTAEELRKLSEYAPAPLLPDETAFLDDYRSLNSEGKQEARNHMDYILSQDRYRKDGGSSEGLGSA